MKRGNRPIGKRRFQNLPLIGRYGLSKSALLDAYHLSEEASKFGFDWKDEGGVLNKITEEMKELKRAIKRGKREEVREEFGDLLFSLVNLSRHLKINPETALTKATAKFWRRWQGVKREMKKKGRELNETNLKEMDEIWERQKRKRLSSRGRASPASNG